MSKYSITSTVPLLFLAAVLGCFCVVVPPHIFGIKNYYEAPLFPLVRTAIENLHLLPTAISLLVLGVILGFLNPRHWLLLGFGTILVFPLVAIAEMLVDPKSHNLWPIEFALYVLLLGMPAIVGAFLGRCCRRGKIPNL